MSMDVTLPDGTVIKGVPDGTTKAQLADKLKAKGYKVPDSWMAASRPSPIDKKQFFSPEATAARRQAEQDKMVAGMDKVTIGVPGVPSLQVQVNAPGSIARGIAGIGEAVHSSGQGLGQIRGTTSKEDVARSRATDAALNRTTAGKVGNVLGYGLEAVPVALATPEIAAAGGTALAAKTIAGGVSGAAQGYAAPYTSTGEHIANTVAGAGLGVVFPGAGAAAGKVVNGLATPEARALIADGVKLTPGQMLGGMFRTAEDKLTSVPIVGDAIRNAQQRSVESFSDAAINRVLGQLDMKLPKGVPSGRQALNYAQDAVSDMYNKTLGQMKATVDSQFRADIGQLWNKYASRLGPKADEFLSSITDGVLGKMKPSGATDGQIVHEIQSDLGKQAKRLMGKELQSDKTLGYAIKDLQNSVKDMMKRQNSPELNAAYTKAGAAFKNLAKVQKAATYAGSDKGLVTPGTLRQAVRASDASAGKKAYSRGRVAMQDLAETGKDVIPSKVPDSGTAGRLGAADLLAHLAMLPVTGTAGAMAHAAYSQAGQRLMERALTPHVNPVSNFLANLAQSRLATPANALAMRPLSPFAQAPQVPQQ
jgi:hypothetical protein